jgi:hypothetical protein
MKVLVLGGYGVFGGRLARLLIADGVQVVIAGRNHEKASAFARDHGGEPLAIDIGKDLAPIAAAAPALVVDAAGPFQAYGSDPYRVARFCIRHGINYADLSDDAEFTAGIVALDRDALAAGCFALSGASSVPAISAAAVTALREGLSAILLIETAILPGNRAPRGRSVMASILRQAGGPLMIWRGGAWREHRGWTDARKVSLAPGLERWANLIGAPDLKLFPAAFQARSVLFRAGLQLGVMHWGLTLLSHLRAIRLLPGLESFLGPLLWLSRTLEWFGGDKGGMAVTVVGTRAGTAIRRQWRVIANDGDGPYIPAIPTIAITRKMPAIAPGARPCLGDLTLPEIATAMARLSVRFSTFEEPAPSFFEEILGPAWKKLPVSIRRSHAIQDIESFSGRATVTRGTGLLARLAAWFFRFPEAGENVPLTITKRRTARGETWERNFAGRKFRSYLTASRRPSHYNERFFAFIFEQELPVIDGSLYLPVRRGWFLGVPLPKVFLPRSESREYDVDGAFHFDVGLYGPLNGGLIVRYQGQVSPDCESTSEAVLRSRSMAV